MAHHGQGQQRKRRGTAVRHLHMHSRALLRVYILTPAMPITCRMCNVSKAAAQAYRNARRQTAR